MTKREIENLVRDYAAKAYYQADLSKKEIKDRIQTALKQILAVSYLLPLQGKDFRFGTNRRIINIISSMQQDIKAIVLKRSYAVLDVSARLNKRLDIEPVEWDNHAWINSTRFRKNFDTRLSQYTDRLKMEMEAYIAVSQDKGLSEHESLLWFMDNINSPHANPELMAATGFIAIQKSKVLRVPFGGIKPGFRSIDRLAEDNIVSSYHIANDKSWGAKGLMKYIVTRGDSLVCGACQLNAGRVFKAEEFVVPVHASCRCVEIPILA